MIKSPVEGSTAALVRLETPVVYSDFVRPICLADEMSEMFRKMQTQQQQIKNPNQLNKKRDSPYAEKLEVTTTVTTIWPETNRKPMLLKESVEFFESPVLNADATLGDHSADNEFIVDFVSNGERMPRAEALQQAKPTLEYPLPKEPPQTSVFKKTNPQPNLAVAHYANAAAQQVINERQTAQQWSNCNTLGWTRTKNQLQRVQLKIGEMAACENVSITTVNSMCAEAVYHKQDCSVSGW